MINRNLSSTNYPMLVNSLLSSKIRRSKWRVFLSLSQRSSCNDLPPQFVWQESVDLKSMSDDLELRPSKEPNWRRQSRARTISWINNKNKFATIKRKMINDRWSSTADDLFVWCKSKRSNYGGSSWPTWVVWRNFLQTFQIAIRWPHANWNWSKTRAQFSLSGQTMNLRARYRNSLVESVSTIVTIVDREAIKKLGAATRRTSAFEFASRIQSSKPFLKTTNCVQNRNSRFHHPLEFVSVLILLFAN